MRYRFYLISFLLTIGVTSPAFAQDTRYRVEVIVLTHLQHANEPLEVATLRDYSEAVDFLTPRDEADEEAEPDEARVAEQPAAMVGTEAPADGAPADVAPDIEADEAPPPLVHIATLSDAMQDAWRRLRLSARFRPLLSLAWEQNDVPPFPLLRVHGDDPILTDDPWSTARTVLESGEPLDEAFVAELLATLPPPPPTPPDAILEDDLAAEPPPSDGEAADDPLRQELLERLPAPRTYYALDGTVSLVRSRFLHLYIDLQQREAVYAPLDPEAMPVLPRGLRTMPVAQAADDAEPAEAEPVPSAFRVFDFTQNRQVKTGQIEYFDGPVLSVLAYITAIEPAEDEP